MALLQEALRPPHGFPFEIAPAPDDSWGTVGSSDGYRTAVVWRGDRVDARAQPLGTLGDDNQFVFCVSRAGTLAAVDVRLGDETLTVVSAYAFWEIARSEGEQLWAYTDASAHRL